MNYAVRSLFGLAITSAIVCFNLTSITVVHTSSLSHQDVPKIGSPTLSGSIKPNPARGKFNGKLVFYSNRNNARGFSIWTMNADGSSPTRLTDDSSRTARSPGFVRVYDTNPVWSPDGSKIAFVSNRDSLFAIYIMNADGSNAHLVTSSVQDPGALAWSPAGDKIAFSAGTRAVVGLAKPSVQIYTVKIDGSELTRLTSEGEINESPSWSPDGKQIVFEGKRDPDRQMKIWVMNADGSNQKMLTGNTGSAVFGGGPLWSPDGNKILFSGFSSFNGTRNCGLVNCAELFVMNADGSNIMPLTNDPTRDGGLVARWSPDGTKIVAAGSVGSPAGRRNGISSSTGIVVMNSDGTNPVTISHRGERNFFDCVGDWQPLSASTVISSSILGFSEASYTASDNAGSATVTVKRTGNLNEAASCSYALWDGAMVQNGYAPVSGRLRFAAGEASKPISIPLEDRPIALGNWSFKVVLSDNEGNATFIGGIREATLTILNEGASPRPRSP